MENCFRNPVFTGQKLRIFLLGAIILMGILPIFTVFIQKTVADVASEKQTANTNQKGLVFLENNTLVPVSDITIPAMKVSTKVPVVVTAYSSTIWETDSDPFITAKGTFVREGIVANNKYPFGTRLRMPELYGDKIFIVEDRMHPRKSDYHFDIWFPSYSQALDFGAKITYIEVLTQ